MVSELSLGVIHHPKQLYRILIVRYAAGIVQIVIIHVYEYICVFRIVDYVSGGVRMIHDHPVAVGVALLVELKRNGVCVGLVLCAVDHGCALHRLNNYVSGSG